MKIRSVVKDEKQKLLDEQKKLQEMMTKIEYLNAEIEGALKLIERLEKTRGIITRENLGR